MIRWLSRRKSVSFEVISAKFTPAQIKGAFRRGFIKMNADRDAYTMTKKSRDFLNKANQPPVLCVHCLTYNLKFAHYCDGCKRATKYRIALNAKIMKRLS